MKYSTIELITLLITRYIGNLGSDHSISFIVRITYITLMISCCAITLIISIMHGLQQSTYQTFKGTHADIIVEHHTNNWHTTAELLKKIPPIKSVAPFAQHHALIKNPNVADFFQQN